MRIDSYRIKPWTTGISRVDGEDLARKEWLVGDEMLGADTGDRAILVVHLDPNLVGSARCEGFSNP